MLTLIAAMLTGCATAPAGESGKAALREEVQAAIARFKSVDPGMLKHFEKAHAYAVFPTVGKGGVGVGGAYGRGAAYEQGAFVGYCDLSQATVGAQLGGQSYSEVIFFQDKLAFNSFKNGKVAFAAQASAVAAKAGASADADYEDGVMVFTLPRGGLMGEATIGGQNFTFEPAN